MKSYRGTDHLKKNTSGLFLFHRVASWYSATSFKVFSAANPISDFQYWAVLFQDGYLLAFKASGQVKCESGFLSRLNFLSRWQALLQAALNSTS